MGSRLLRWLGTSVSAWGPKAKEVAVVGHAIQLTRQQGTGLTVEKEAEANGTNFEQSARHARKKVLSGRGDRQDEGGRVMEPRRAY